LANEYYYHFKKFTYLPSSPTQRKQIKGQIMYSISCHLRKKRNNLKLKLLLDVLLLIPVDMISSFYMRWPQWMGMEPCYPISNTAVLLTGLSSGSFSLSLVVGAPGLHLPLTSFITTDQSMMILCLCERKQQSFYFNKNKEKKKTLVASISFLSPSVMPLLSYVL